MYETTADKLKMIDKEIEDVQQKIRNTHGTETEVYARIVGYYRAVRNWNAGKASEFKDRVTFEVPKESKEPDVVSDSHKTSDITVQEAVASNVSRSVYAEVYTRKTCPNCPPVLEILKNASVRCEYIDVDEDAGLQHAGERGVFSSPTVILFDGDKEIARAHDTEQLRTILSDI